MASQCDSVKLIVQIADALVIAEKEMCAPCTVNALLACIKSIHQLRGLTDNELVSLADGLELAARHFRDMAGEPDASVPVATVSDVGRA